MRPRTTIISLSILFPMILSVGTMAAAQNKAETLRKEYRFLEAAEICRTALSDTTLSPEDRTPLEDELMLNENASRMMEFCARPTIVAKHTFSKKEFFLFYPLRDHSWRMLPNQLDSLAPSGFVRSTYVPQDAETIYYSAADANGVRNLYRTHLSDSLWTAPELINEQVTSSSDEIFPMLSPDGKTLYFASDGLYGMGGYDIYYSTWDEDAKDWDAPVNMGFPYSSPFDDFLFINTEDGRYSIFASNRECQKDSVCIYVLEFDNMPLRQNISDPGELAVLCTLNAENDPMRIDNTSAMPADMSENAGARHYIELVGKIKAMRNSVYTIEDINELVALQARLSEATKELQAIEMEFLVSGVVIDADKLAADAQKEVVGVSSSYAFTKNNAGPKLEMKIEEIVPVFDYTFKILPEGQFAEDNTLPEGLIYQIQLFATGKKVGVEQLKGLSPVFERQSNGKYIYSAGLFRSYADVLSNLNSVKKVGFKSAMITAYRDGQPLAVKTARTLESQIKTLFKVRLNPADGKGLTEAERSVIHQMTEKDIMRINEGGAVIFEIGPFDNENEAEEIATALRAAGASSISVEVQSSD